MAETITVTSFEDAEKLVTTQFWVESFFFADTAQGETAEENFNRAYQIIERNESDMVHYEKIS